MLGQVKKQSADVYNPRTPNKQKFGVLLNISETIRVIALL
jgi:hypothetical protein